MENFLLALDKCARFATVILNVTNDTKRSKRLFRVEYCANTLSRISLKYALSFIDQTKQTRRTKQIDFNFSFHLFISVEE